MIVCDVANCKEREYHPHGEDDILKLGKASEFSSSWPVLCEKHYKELNEKLKDLLRGKPKIPEATLHGA